jgi:hypothetical protein
MPSDTVGPHDGARARSTGRCDGLDRTETRTIDQAFADIDAEWAALRKRGDPNSAEQPTTDSVTSNNLDLSIATARRPPHCTAVETSHEFSAVGGEFVT